MANGIAVTQALPSWIASILGALLVALVSIGYAAVNNRLVVLEENGAPVVRERIAELRAAANGDLIFRGEVRMFMADMRMEISELREKLIELQTTQRLRTDTHTLNTQPGLPSDLLPPE